MIQMSSFILILKSFLYNTLLQEKMGCWKEPRRPLLLMVALYGRTTANATLFQSSCCQRQTLGFVGIFLSIRLITDSCVFIGSGLGPWLFGQIRTSEFRVHLSISNFARLTPHDESQGT